MEQEFKVVASYSDPLRAEITAGMLRANGIPAQVFGQTTPYPCINSALDAVTVKVNASDYEAAVRLVEGNDEQ